jgi:hypothetical protein
MGQGEDAGVLNAEGSEPHATLKYYIYQYLAAPAGLRPAGRPLRRSIV